VLGLTVSTSPLFCSILFIFFHNLAELVVDRAVDLTYFGGVYAGNVKPTPFLCLIFKLLQIRPNDAIIQEYVNQEDFK